MVSPGTRVELADMNTTQRPLPLIEGGVRLAKEPSYDSTGDSMVPVCRS